MKKVLFFAAVIMFLTACSSVMITGRKQLLLVPDADVLSMSATSYKQFVDSMPASKDVANTALVRKVGKKIARAVFDYMKANGMGADTANYSWEFNLIKDNAVNAFCMPGGKVVFFEGILPVTKTEAGMAVVMGHEVAHAIAKHSNERMSQQLLTQYGATFTDLLMSKKSDATRQVVNTLYGVGTQVGVMLPYSRKHEYEADQLGVVFMAMAGYNPTESIAFWERMAASNTGSAPAEIMSTHPSDANRIQKMKDFLPEAMKYYKK
jgi:predicted Zn-dependent protease